jgi:hypothetical protein
LGDRFTEEEVWNVIRSLLPDKALGPYDFTARFLHAAWQIIRPDLIAVLDAFWRCDTRSFHSLNQALMILLPKSSEVPGIRDFRPIALIQSIGKLVSKILANRLAPRLPMLMHRSQSAFIIGWYIQDNFRFVHSEAKLLHAKHQACLLLKVDITKAFDSVTWSFLLEVLKFIGFPVVWSNWISTLLSTASMCIILNGVPRDSIHHGRELR